MTSNQMSAVQQSRAGGVSPATKTKVGGPLLSQLRTTSNGAAGTLDDHNFVGSPVGD